MELLGLHWQIWIVVAAYFVGMLLLGWWSKRGIHDREGFLLGNRQFGWPMMVMHAFGAGTHPGDVAGVTSKTVERGGSGIWVSWMWMFGTPFYWIIAPIIRRTRCLTMADIYEERFGPAAAILYVAVAAVSGTIICASVLLATTRTVQGMMGKATVVSSPASPAPGAARASAGPGPAVSAPGGLDIADEKEWATRGVGSAAEADAWFFGILIVTTAVFVVYSYWGGIVAAIRTDMVQGLMIIALSFIAIPMALELVGGWEKAKEVLEQARTSTRDPLGLFDPKYFSLLAVLVLVVNAPISMMAQPHLITVTSAGRTEWEGRVGFTYGNVLKRICTMGWCILGLCWLAFLIVRGVRPHPDAAFGDSVAYLLPPVLQGLMLACIMAAAMSTGDALQVTVAGLISQNVYRRHVRPGADEGHCLRVTRLAGLVVIVASVAVAVAMRRSVVASILAYFNLTATAGIALVMGVLWRRMNAPGVFACIGVAAATFLATSFAIEWKAADLAASGAAAIVEVPRGQVERLRQEGRIVLKETPDDPAGPPTYHALTWTARAGQLPRLVRWELLAWSGTELRKTKLTCTLVTTTATPLLLGALAGVIGSLLTKPPRREAIEPFFKKMYVPIGQEARLVLPLDEAVPPDRRLLTAGGLFIVKPSTQSWLGFVVTLAICLALVGLMLWLLA